MKPLHIKIIAIVAAVVLLGSAIVGIVTVVNQGNADDRINTQEEQIEAINSSITDLKALDTQLGTYIDALEATAAELEIKLTAANTALETAKTEIYAEIDAESAALLAKLTADKDALTAELAKTNEALEAAKTANAASEKAITDQIAALKTELEKADADNKKAIEAQITTLNNDLSALIEKNAEDIVALETTAADLQTQINNTNTEIDKIKTELEGKISESENKVLGKLNTLKTDINGKLETVNNSITALKAKDEDLTNRIVALETYVETELQNTKNWANDTFSTLKQYEQTQTDISGINALIVTINNDIDKIKAGIEEKVGEINKSISNLDTELKNQVEAITTAYTTAIATAKTKITTAYTKAIDDAIKKLDTDMKAWVNGVLAEGYYNMTEIDGKITALETKITDGDTALQAQITTLKADLEQAKKDLTEAYEKAITDAVAEDGVISDAIAEAVKTAQDNLQAQIDAINVKIIGIEARLNNIESQIATLLDQIQSVTFVPQYSDGKVRMDYTTRRTSLDFMINPTRLSADLATAWAADNTIIKAYVRYTDDPTTRAVASPMELTIASVTASTSDEGMINIEVKEDESFSEAFWNGGKEAVIYIVITNGVTEISSDAIPIVAHNYAGNTNSISGFFEDDGDYYYGEASE